MTAKRFGPGGALLGVCVALVFALCLNLTTPSAAGGGDDDALSLSVTIQSRHISHFEVCIPVKVDEPFRIVWGDENVRDSISGVLRPPDGEVYPVSLAISEGGGSCRETTAPRLKLGEPREWANVVSATFNHIDKRKAVLSKGACP